MQYRKAKIISDRIIEILTPTSMLINSAGSVLREKQEVKDIEIVCLPKHQNMGMFGDEKKIDPMFIEFSKMFVEKIIKGNFGGRYMQIKMRNTDILLDLFMPVEEDYYRQLAIRTGSSVFTTNQIAAGWKRKGWCGVKDMGLRKITDCENVKAPDAEKDVWKCINPNPELPPVWKSEHEFFDWLGIKYVEPKFRF